MEARVQIVVELALDLSDLSDPGAIHRRLDVALADFTRSPEVVAPAEPQVRAGVPLPVVAPVPVSASSRAPVPAPKPGFKSALNAAHGLAAATTETWLTWKRPGPSELVQKVVEVLRVCKAGTAREISAALTKMFPGKYPTPIAPTALGPALTTYERRLKAVGIAPPFRSKYADTQRGPDAGRVQMWTLEED